MPRLKCMRETQAGTSSEISFCRWIAPSFTPTQTGAVSRLSMMQISPLTCSPTCSPNPLSLCSFLPSLGSYLPAQSDRYSRAPPTVTLAVPRTSLEQGLTAGETPHSARESTVYVLAVEPGEEQPNFRPTPTQAAQLETTSSPSTVGVTPPEVVPPPSPVVVVEQVAVEPPPELHQGVYAGMSQRERSPPSKIVPLSSPPGHPVRGVFLHLPLVLCAPSARLRRDD